VSLGEPSDRHPAVVFLDPLTEAFVAAGKTLYLVGGIVRGLMLGSYSEDDDLDLTTDARPGEIKDIIRPVVSSIWNQGEKFGTIGARFQGRPVEITTHRAESYNSDSRKPIVSFGDDLATDLSRRDFTINAMAMALPDATLIDPYGGRDDLNALHLRTPLDPAISFGDDPLRILRAARFMTRFNLDPTPELVTAAKSMASRLDIVSIERIQVEIELLLGLDNPSGGLEFLREVGVTGFLFGPLESAEGIAAASIPGHNGTLRRCALLSQGGAEGAKQWLSDHRYSTEDRRRTHGIIGGAEELSDVGNTPAEVRRFVAKVGLGRVDSVFALAELRPDLYNDPAEIRLIYERLGGSEDLSDLGSPLSGSEIMELLDIGASRAVGAASKMLASHRIDTGPLTKAEATTLLEQWWNVEK
jgi:poly(A) polymerase